MPRTKHKSKFVRSRQTETLSTLTDALVSLDAAVAESDTAISERLETYNRLLHPKHSKSLSVEDLTRDANQRKYDHVAAVHRERAAFEELCAAMDTMLPLLTRVNEKLVSAKFEDADFKFNSLLTLNYIEGCKLYKAALAILGRFGDLRYEWTLDTYLGEEAKAASAWLKRVPPLPKRRDEGSSLLPPAFTHLPAVILGRAMSAIDEFGHREGVDNSRGGFLGTVMYASDVKPANGFVGICLGGEREDIAGQDVAVLLRQAGWDAFCQSNDRGDLQVNLGRKRTTRAR